MQDRHDVEHILINPIYAISIDPDLEGRHDPIVPRAQWIAANSRLIGQLGAEDWLERLLAVLEGNFPRNPDDAGAANGYTATAE